MNQIKKLITRTFPYFLLFGISIFLLLRYKTLHLSTIAPILGTITYIFLGVALFLSIHYQRTRAFFTLTLFMAAFFLIKENALITKTLPFFQNYSVAFLSLALPLNLALIAFSRERGFFTAAGVLKSTFILAQFVLLFYIAYSQNTAFLDLLFTRIFPPGLTSPAALADAALIIAGIALVVILVKNFLSGTFFDLALLGGLIVATLALNYFDKSALFAVFILTATLMVIAALLSESFYLAYHDELTTIPARRALLSHFNKLGRKYSIAMIDIDHFKKFNDTHGHDIGDEVLKLVASKLSAVTGGGTAYRFGGEEFTIVFPGKNADETLEHLEKVRETIEKSPYLAKSKTGKSTKSLFVTISIGVSQKGPDDKEPHQVMKKADNALYKSKKAGRNRVTTA